MEMSRWLSEMGLEEPDSIAESQMNTFSDLTAEQLAAAFGEDFQQSSYADTNIGTSCIWGGLSPLEPEAIWGGLSPLEPEAIQTCLEKPTKQLKNADSGSSCTAEKVVLPDDSQISQEGSVNQNYAPKADHRKKRAFIPNTNPESNTNDHIMAERKRREKLSQQFITLTTIVPGLKKMDKSSVLGDSIKYLKELQEKVKALEEQTTRNKMESVLFASKFRILPTDDTWSVDDNSTNTSSEQLPVIEARFSDRNVLIRIHCEKKKGILGKVIDTIEELNLSVVNSSIISFGTSTLDVTVMAEMDDGLNMTVRDLLEHLRSSFCEFM